MVVLILNMQVVLLQDVHGVGKKFVLRLIGPAGKSLRVTGMTALYFLQEHEIGVQHSQMLANFVYHQPALEKR